MSTTTNRNTATIAEYEKELVKKGQKVTNFEILFDNGGGATLQVSGTEFVHHYDDMKQLADDVRALADGASVADWEGNEPEFHVDDKTYLMHHQNGGYRALDQDTWKENHTESDWRNIREFSASVAGN